MLQREFEWKPMEPAIDVYDGQHKYITKRILFYIKMITYFKAEDKN